MTKRSEINMHLNVFSTLNYVLFDLVFAAAIHVLTADVAGLSNCKSVLSFAKEDLDFRQPPFQGSGITCTKKRIFYILYALRLVAWLLVFATTFCIQSISHPVYFYRSANVTTLGAFDPFTPGHFLNRKAVLRRGCQGRTNISTYYGEIRNGSCEINPELLSNPVHFGLKYVPTNVSTVGCESSLHAINMFNCTKKGDIRPTRVQCSYYTKWKSENRCALYGSMPVVPCKIVNQVKAQANISCSMPEEARGAGAVSQKNGTSTKIMHCTRYQNSIRRNDRCNNALVGCFYSIHGFICPGAVSINGVTHLCKNLSSGLSGVLRPCKMARGAAWNITEWPLAIGSPNMGSIEDAYAIAYGSGFETRPVKFLAPEEESLHATVITPAWYAILCVKLLAILSLCAVIILLRRGKGLHRIANDEYEMRRLLSAASRRVRSRIAPPQEDNLNENEVYVKLVNNEIFIRANQQD